MRLWPVLFLAAIALAVYSGWLRAESDPPPWTIPVHVATIALFAAAEALRRRSKTTTDGDPHGTV